MSRYAIEWAKRQQLGDPSTRIVLILLGDEAEGRDSKHESNLAQLAEEAGLSPDQFRDAIAVLMANGLIEASESIGAAGQDRLAFRLLIPPKWRLPYALVKRPKSDGDENLPTAVYRLYDTAGQLLYVGISDDPPDRFRGHERTKPWWREVATREVIWYESRRLASAEECRAIGAEGPLYNAHDTKRITGDGGSFERARRRYVVTGGRFMLYEKLTARLAEDIESGKYDNDLLPDTKALAESYGVDAVLMAQSLEALRREYRLTVSDRGYVTREDWYD